MSGILHRLPSTAPLRILRRGEGGPPYGRVSFLVVIGSSALTLGQLVGPSIYRL